MEYKHSYKDIAHHTGLKTPFMRKCFAAFKNLLEHRRGPKNTILFNDNALIVWQQIADKKSQGSSLQEIEEFLKNELENGRSNRIKLEDANPSQSKTLEGFEQVLLVYEKTIGQKDSIINQQQQMIEQQRIELSEARSQIKLLEDQRKGRSQKKGWLDWLKRSNV